MAPVSPFSLLPPNGFIVCWMMCSRVSFASLPADACSSAGMASGISGTMRFTGIVLGFAALGVALFSRISSNIIAALPAVDGAARFGFIREVASGNLSGSGLTSTATPALRALALESFTRGYATLFTVAAALCLVATILTWWLVRAADTQPIAKQQRGKADTVGAPAIAGGVGGASARFPAERDRKINLRTAFMGVSDCETTAAGTRIIQLDKMLCKEMVFSGPGMPVSALLLTFQRD